MLAYVRPASLPLRKTPVRSTFYTKIYTKRKTGNISDGSPLRFALVNVAPCKSTLAKLASDRSQHDRLAPFKQVPVKSAPLIFSPQRNTPVRLTFLSNAFVSRALVRTAKLKLTSDRLHPARLASVRLVQLKSAPQKLIPDRSHSVKSAPLSLDFQFHVRGTCSECAGSFRRTVSLTKGSKVVPTVEIFTIPHFDLISSALFLLVHILIQDEGANEDTTMSLHTTNLPNVSCPPYLPRARRRLRALARRLNTSRSSLRSCNLAEPLAAVLQTLGKGKK